MGGQGREPEDKAFIQGLPYAKSVLVRKKVLDEISAIGCVPWYTVHMPLFLKSRGQETTLCKAPSLIKGKFGQGFYGHHIWACTDIEIKRHLEVFCANTYSSENGI